ncbi:MAG: ABC transporter ATP-binding protein [Caldisericia bacterium]|jgi:cobalt/nickel transport system ATP-binding protein|nr:ABC transporter ATP-binding protein [Caldisericia bacterium]
MREAIVVKNLNFSYENSNFKLQNINFVIYERENIGIIGKNGSGKTTLILNLVGILKGDGLIKIFDIPLKKENLKEIRKKVQIVFQNPDDQLFSPTVFDDISFGLLNLGLKEDEVMKRVDDVLKDINMVQYKNYFPNHLSFGEKKKISIATILSMRPEIIIFDEPTQGLDPKSRREIIEIIKKIDGTKIIVSHDLDMIYNLCSKIILLYNGKIISFDDKDKILKDKKLLEECELI